MLQPQSSPLLPAARVSDMGLALDDPLSPSKPPPGLTRVEAKIAYLTVFGLPRPLTVEEAARAEGYRVKRARNYLADLPAFNLYRRALLRERRESEAARNLATAIAIRDDKGDGSAATKTVQLKAIAVIEGNDKAPAVTVNVNQQTNVAAISPGYVIRLPARRSEP
jgi:hypothetical protein